MVDLGKNEEPGKKPREKISCRMKGCPAKATFAVVGSKKGEVCRKHATGRHDMVDLYGLRCAQPGCTRKNPSFGPPSPPARWDFCAAHRKPGMVDVRGFSCFRGGCGKERFYGVPGSNFPEFCATHALDGMARMRTQSCDHTGCRRVRKYGAPGSNRAEAEFCALHADEGMVDLFKNWDSVKACSHPGCAQEAEYGPTLTARHLCIEHAADGMLGPRGWVKAAVRIERSPPEPAAVSSVAGQCGHPSGCTKKATHGVRGSRERELCLEHAQGTQLVYLSGYWCTAPGCSKWPSFGVAGGARECCGSHAKEGMVNVSSGGIAYRTPAPEKIKSGVIKRELSCEGPCVQSTPRQGAGAEDGSEHAPPETGARQRESSSQPAEPFMAGKVVVGEAAGAAKKGNQVAWAEPADPASQADVVEPFMGFKRRRRRVDWERPLGLEAGLQELGCCEEVRASHRRAHDVCACQPAFLVPLLCGRDSSRVRHLA